VLDSVNTEVLWAYAGLHQIIFTTWPNLALVLLKEDMDSAQCYKSASVLEYNMITIYFYV
jgi:hypothetical protein